MLSQHLTGSLMRQPCHASEEDLTAIRALPNPPLISLETDEIHVRKCRLASDAIDSRYGRFHTSDLPRLMELVQGAPVLIGHDRRTLGIARFFGGSIETRDNVSWLVPRFYWPRGHSRAEDLRVMIDSGVYNEASIAFLYERPTCSICGEDLRGCPHWPGRSYDGELCFFWYDNIERVTEGSLVYRGAAPGTGIELTCDSGVAGSTPQGTDNIRPAENSTSERRITLKHRGKRFQVILKH